MNSKLFRFEDKWDLVIAPHEDNSVSFVFWSLKCGETRLNDHAEPAYVERFG